MVKETFLDLIGIYFLFFSLPLTRILAGNVLEQIASNAKADYASLVKKFLSACKHRTVKSDSINEEMAVKG